MECMCGITDPKTAPDIKAYRRDEFNIHDDEDIHRLMNLRNTLVDIHNELMAMSDRGIGAGMLDDVGRDNTGAAIDAIDSMIFVDPEDAEGYAD